jgi:hypothetical protein
MKNNKIIQKRPHHLHQVESGRNLVNLYLLFKEISYRFIYEATNRFRIGFYVRQHGVAIL